MSEFRMPSLGADMEAGTLVEWLVKPGDHVERGDIVAVVDTDKAAIEVEVFESGVIGEILVEVGTKVPVGTPLATIESDEAQALVEAAPAVVEAAPPPEPEPAPPPPEPARAVAPPGVKAHGNGHVTSSPLARRLAKERGVDLAHVHGTGPGGAVTRDDVERAVKGVPREEPAEEPVATAAPATAAATADDRRAAMRRAIGALMARSKREIPHYYLSAEIDMRRALAWLEEHNAGRSPAERVLPAALQLKAVALAVRDYPDMNGFWVDDAFVPGAGAHLGVAISLRQGGLIAPAIHDADTMSVDELMAALRDLVQRARAGSLRASEMSDPTITVTNLGDQGVETVFGVIYPPQVALVGFGKITERPHAADGMIGVHPMVTGTLAADHRASDGHRGGLFLAAIDRYLQEPERL